MTIEAWELDLMTTTRIDVVDRNARSTHVVPLLGALSVLLGVTAMIAADTAHAGGLNSVRASAVRAPAWQLEPTPNPLSAQISVLSSVSCPSTRTCTAVGSAAATLSSPTKTLAERWNGHSWHTQPNPTPKGTSDTLYGVSCPSAWTCVAVGTAFHTADRRNTPLIEAWSGRRWRVQATSVSAASSSLAAVSCTSRSSCMAVGSTLTGGQRAVAERWNGRAWRRQTLPRPAVRTVLLGVSCSRPRACTAVGYEQGTGNARPLAESWNGRRWQLHAVPLPPSSQGRRAGILEAVSCTSPRACTATGTDFTHPGGPTLAERWNGRAWRVQRTPNPANFAASLGEVTLDGVSCTSARACTATGSYNPGHADYFTESWNGGRWRLEPAPHPAGFAHGSLLGISCTSTRCAAVGAYTGTGRLQATLALSR